MLFTNNISNIGYKHIKENKCCQDYSLSFKDNERAIVAVADGHGGNIYIRSQHGSKFACLAALDVLKSIRVSDIKKINNQNLENSIKLSILNSWNSYVDNHYRFHRITNDEKSHITDNQLADIITNHFLAYGSTLSTAMLIDRYWIFISLGDTEIFGVKNKTVYQVFDNEEDPCGSATNSLCQDDAYQHIKVKICHADEYDLVVICSDGLTSPYVEYDAFYKSFINPLSESINKNKNDYNAQKVVERLSSKEGNGDDVSYAIIQKT